MVTLLLVSAATTAGGVVPFAIAQEEETSLGEEEGFTDDIALTFQMQKGDPGIVAEHDCIQFKGKLRNCCWVYNVKKE